MAARKTMRWVYDRLICEYGHWDFCLSGFVNDDGEIKLVKFSGKAMRPLLDDPCYRLIAIEWDDELREWLADYMAAFPWWCYQDGKRQSKAKQDREATLRMGDKWGERYESIKAKLGL